jgi:transposase InsO family protein
MSERQCFLAEATSGEESFSAVCRKYKISRKTGYKWLHRSENGEGIENRSKKPLCSPNRTSPETEALVLGERDQHPAWGPRKLKQALLNKGYENVPCKSTIENILKRNNRIEPEASEASTPFKRFERSKPNELWQMDFKGDFGMLNGQRCYPLTILDDHSRFSLCLNANSGINYTEFKPVFTRVL